MPTNLKSQVKKLVRLKSGESCHALKRHCEEGVLREVIGAWEALLRKYPNDKSFIYPDVDWTVKQTVKGHDKKLSFALRTNHGRWMVEKAYLAARELGFVSRPLEMEINGVMRRGFILTPHDALCQRTEVGCLLVGPYKIKGTSWHSEMGFKDGKPTGKRTIIFKGFVPKGTEEGKDQGTEEGKDQGTEEGKEEGTGEGKDRGKENVSQQGQGKVIGEVIENGTVTEKFTAISEPDFGPYLPSPLALSVRQYHQDPPTHQTPETPSVDIFPSVGLTDLQNPTPQRCEEQGNTPSPKDESRLGDKTDCAAARPAPMTVGSFFQDVDDGLLIPKLTCGYISTDEVNRWDGTNPRTKKRGQLATNGQLIQACRQVINENARRVIRQERDLADIMVRAMKLCTEKTDKRVPLPWLPTIQKLERSSELLIADTPKPGHGTMERSYVTALWQAIRYSGINVDEYSEALHALDLTFRQSEKEDICYRDVWEYTHYALKQPDFKKAYREIFTLLRDWCWEHDFAPGKPTVPPWKEPRT